jgi:hypothetical protein
LVQSWNKVERGERVEEQQRREQLTGMGRPGLVTFAAVMMGTMGGFHILLAVSEFARSTWELTRLDIELVIPIFIFWGLFDLMIGIIAVYAGVIILRGGSFGLITGFVFATLSAIRWLFYIPVSPVLAIVIIALDVLVIYGLAEHSDYFQGG